MRALSSFELYENQDFQSAMVRLGVWGFAAIYVSAGALSNRYEVDINSVLTWFVIYLMFFIAILVSVLIRPEWNERRYFSLGIDISATTACMFLIGDAASPFFILYVWIFVSYGTRYGRRHLKIASIMSMAAYSLVLTALGQWVDHFLEALFVLLALGVLPVYQYSLIRKLHSARSEAERSNHMVGRFLSNMTNEMRGPLVDILGTTRELAKQEHLIGRGLDKIDDINSSASILDSVIGDVLDFYKLESKQFHLQSVPFNVHNLVVEVSSSMVRLALLKQKELVCSVASGVPNIIVGDEQRLKQVLTNVMRTAIDCCLGDELLISVKIDNSNHEMLLFEVNGIAPLASGDAVEFEDDLLAVGELSNVNTGLGSDQGNSFASRLVVLMGGEFGFGPRENGIIYWFTFPARSDDDESYKVSKLPVLQGKRAFIFEPNNASREEIVRCCIEQEMKVEAVNKVGELSDCITGLKEKEDVDLIVIADSPTGRNMGRIADICHDVLGSDLPLLVLSYKRNCIDLDVYSSVVLMRKPFLHSQLATAMEKALTLN